MKNFLLSLLFLSFLSSSIYAGDPPYYLKGNTWIETMFNSREKLMNYEEQNERNNPLTLKNWFAIGPFVSETKKPFSESFPPEKEINLNQSYDNGTQQWHEEKSWVDGSIINFPHVDFSDMYLYRIINSKIDTTVTACLGSDDGIHVWLNDSLLLQDDVQRGVQKNQEKVNLNLKKGENHLLVKINNGSGDFAFYFSLQEEDPADVIWSLLERDFNSPQDKQEIRWERSDSIWNDNWKIGDYSEIASRYAKVIWYDDSVLYEKAEEFIPSVNDFASLQKVRELYLKFKGDEYAILTPKPPLRPEIHGPKIFGVRPGNPFLYMIPATGQRPLVFSAVDLPKGLELNAKTGEITGSVLSKGKYDVALQARNSFGSASRQFEIIVGNKICLTPALGWNSWNCFATDVNAKDIRAAADAMVKTGLINHGWTYINIDDSWSIKPDSKDSMIAGVPRNKNGMINSNKKFPDMRALSDYVHGKGLKLGIYSSPGPLTCAGYTASYQHELQDAEQFAKWGIDYLKYDWCSYGTIAKDNSLAELEKPYIIMREALNKVPRDIVYSLCQYGMGDVWEWGNKIGGNSWRTTGDIRDTWESMSTIGFSQNGHEKYAGPGHWNDPDMLVVGVVGWGSNLHPTQLTPDEQYTHISLWCLLSAPLLIGCDLTQLDNFTLGLLTNDEVLEIDQDALGKQASRVSKNGDLEVWAKDLQGGSKAVGLFNRGKKRTRVSIAWKDLGIKGIYVVRDLWRQKNIGKFSNKFSADVNGHGVVLVKLTKTSEK
jgi:alpha-galactosidase